MQYKNKKNLYKIVFITILLGFIISLVGCNWLSLGLLNIFDPQAQIRVNYTLVDLTEGAGSISLEIYSLNEVEFIGSGFEYDYYIGTTKIPELSKMVGATFYVAPSTSPGTPGPITKIDNLPLYFQEVLDYLTLNPLITEITCTINLIGTDGAGHDITKSVTFDLPALQPGIDFEPPKVVINTTPDPPSGTAPFTVIFDASGSTDNRGIESYSWDFGDGTSGTEIMETHTYSSCGTYIVILTVTDFWGNEGYATTVITVGEPGGPIAVISTTPSPPTGPAPLTVVFNASGSTIGPDCEYECGCAIESYNWDFGDGNTGIGVNITHTYVNPGTYIVILTMTDSCGNEGYASVVVTVSEVEEVPIYAEINTTPDPPSGTAPFTVYFDAYKSTSESGIVSYEWDFGDGNLETGVTTNHTYSNIGTYTVILTITDSDGKKGYANVEVTVGKVPIAKINTTPDSPSGTAPFTVYFDAYESTSESGIVSYEWDFGDGNLETGVTTNHTYSNIGTYTVILTITDSDGYEGYDSVDVTVN